MAASLLPFRASEEDALAASVPTIDQPMDQPLTIDQGTAAAAAATVAAAAWASVPGSADLQSVQIDVVQQRTAL